MAGVTVYTTGFCGYCTQVMALLARHGIAFTEVNVEDHPGLPGKLLAWSGRRTLPQVYVGERYIGGAAELANRKAAINCPGCGVPSFPGSQVCTNCGMSLVVE